MNWLDTETKEILQKDPEQKTAPSKAGEFALILIREGTDNKRLVRAIRRINDSNEDSAIRMAGCQLPLTINSGLTQAEALLGQFELICCDAIAPFIRSEVYSAQTSNSYLKSLFEKVLESPEFKPTRIDILEVPATEPGEKFVDQFLGARVPNRNRRTCRLSYWSPFSVWVPFKKARIMTHWAARVGVQVKCNALQDSQDEQAR
jgi:hypothetical protein